MMPRFGRFAAPSAVFCPIGRGRAETPVWQRSDPDG
jgi:hypothetical protein